MTPRVEFVTKNRLIIGIWLVLLYALSLWAVVGTFSSYQLQMKIQGNRENVTVSSVIRFLQSVQDLDDQIKLRNKALATLDQEWQKNLQKVSEQEAHLTSLRLEEEKIWLDISATGNYPKTVCQSTESNVDATIQELCQSLLHTQHSITSAKTSLFKVQRKFGSTRMAIEDIRFNLEELKIERRILSENEVMGDYMTEFGGMQAFGFDKIAKLPTELLILILTASMGTLGSLINLTRTFLSDEERQPFSWYALRPFLGMITAIAIFVLTKSGEGMISANSSTSDPTQGLNPFFLSFVAIISGLLSEHAYARIHDAGLSFFKVKPRGTERWALLLQETMQKEKKNAKDLLPFVKVEPSLLDNWIKGKKPVPPDKQEIIAAWLNTPARLLFSDQPNLPKHTTALSQTSDDQIPEPQATKEVAASDSEGQQRLLSP